MADPSTPARKRRKRGQKRVVVAPRAPYIQRRIATFDILSEEGLCLIEHNADRILRDIGMEFHNDTEILDYFRAAGADVQGERVRFEPGLCRQIIQATAPRQYTQHARNAANNVVIGGDNIVLSPVYGPPFVHDLDRGRRYATLADFSDLNRIHQMLPQLHHCGGIVCEPVDIPVNKRHLDMLQPLCDTDLSLAEFPWLSARKIRIADIEVDALRVSYVGVIGFELHHGIDQQAQLLQHILQAGEACQLGFYGAFAMNALRLEMGYRAWGSDLTTERTPLEAGLHHLVKTEGRDFIGRDAMLTRAQRDDHWNMQLLEFDIPEFDPFYAHSLFQGGKAIGVVTSGSFGHRLGKAIGLAYFRNPVAMDDELEVEILGRRSAARITAPL